MEVPVDFSNDHGRVAYRILHASPVWKIIDEEADRNDVWQRLTACRLCGIDMCAVVVEGGQEHPEVTRNVVAAVVESIMDAGRRPESSVEVLSQDRGTF